MSARLNAWPATLLGLAGLASAMGIGRFAFTPALPLLQNEGLSLSWGSWLASSNYLGYWLGALLCLMLKPRPALWSRLGLAGVALATLSMGLTSHVQAWLIARFVAGIASAWVLVGLSAWCLTRLAQLNRPILSGVLYAGVGCGIELAGLTGLLSGALHFPSRYFWLILAAASGLIALWAQFVLRFEHPPSAANGPPAQLDPRHWPLILSYGGFGLGYIIPATFLPAQARQLINDPTLFGWVWPLFGAAAALSTLICAPLAKRFSARQVWAGSALIMALGVVVPLIQNSLTSLLICALCVGGTFMVLTMAAMQEARNQGGARLIAALTASFATGQMLGPLLVAWLQGDLFWPSLISATLLALSLLGLRQNNTCRAQRQNGS